MLSTSRRQNNEQEERPRIVLAVAVIIVEDILSQVHENSGYLIIVWKETRNSFLKVLPTFMEIVVLNKKCGDHDMRKNRTSMAHILEASSEAHSSQKST